LKQSTFRRLYVLTYVRSTFYVNQTLCYKHYMNTFSNPVSSTIHLFIKQMISKAELTGQILILLVVVP
jgi:hypothetical protein